MKNTKPAQRRLGLISILLVTFGGVVGAWAQEPTGRSVLPLTAIAHAAAGQADDGGAPADEAALTLNRIRWHVPDPTLYRPEIEAHIRRWEQSGDTKAAKQARRNLERVDVIRRPKQVWLSMADCLERALAHNFLIESQSYSPAVETTRTVEALAEFDAVFFSTINNSKIDRPSASQLASTSVDQFASTYGIRKRLSSGMQVSGFYELDRQKIALSFQNINPAYSSTFNLEMRQPLLRGFGIDFNRARIRIAKNNRQISDWTFKRQIRDTLRNVDELYWRLVQARRDIAITARLLGQFESIYDYLVARREFDVIPVQLAATKARLERSRSQFIRKRNTVYDAQQRLLAVLNDPALPIGGDAEIIPADFPQLTELVVDPIAEVQTALDNRAELKEQELNIANARIAVGQAKNLELPQLDVTFRYSIDGLSNKAARAFDQMSGSNFQSYFVTVQFEVPLGNRAARAATTRARLQEAQAEAALRARFEDIILDVHVAARQLATSYEQISPSFESAQSREREVASIVARAERKDLNTLNSELSAREALAAERRTMLNALVEYNIAIVDIERAKGTLLRYDNVDMVMSSEPPE